MANIDFSSNKAILNTILILALFIGVAVLSVDTLDRETKFLYWLILVLIVIVYIVSIIYGNSYCKINIPLCKTPTIQDFEMKKLDDYAGKSAETANLTVVCNTLKPKQLQLKKTSRLVYSILIGLTCIIFLLVRNNTDTDTDTDTDTYTDINIDEFLNFSRTIRSTHYLAFTLIHCLSTINDGVFTSCGTICITHFAFLPYKGSVHPTSFLFLRVFLNLNIFLPSFCVHLERKCSYLSRTSQYDSPDFFPNNLFTISCKLYIYLENVSRFFI